MPPYPWTSFKIQKYYQNDSKYNGVYSINNLLRTKNWAYEINFDEFKSTRIHLIALGVNAENVSYFDSFGLEDIPTKIRKLIRYKNVKTNIYRIQAYDSIMCGHFCIEFIDFRVKVKSLLEYAFFFFIFELVFS